MGTGTFLKTAIILAGGENKRIGKIKSLLPLSEKETVIGLMISELKKTFNEIIIVTNKRENFSYLQYLRHLKLKIVEDIIPTVGPIGGIHSGLIHSGSVHSFVIAGDMPFVNTKFIKYMEGFIDAEVNDVVVPKTESGYEPLFAFYSKQCILPIETCIKRKQFSVTSFFKDVKTKEVLVSDSDVIYDKTTFFNIDTEEDYNKAKELYIRN